MNLKQDAGSQLNQRKTEPSYLKPFSTNMVHYMINSLFLHFYGKRKLILIIFYLLTISNFGMLLVTISLLSKRTILLTFVLKSFWRTENGILVHISSQLIIVILMLVNLTLHGLNYLMNIKVLTSLNLIMVNSVVNLITVLNGNKLVSFQLIQRVLNSSKFVKSIIM